MMLALILGLVLIAPISARADEKVADSKLNGEVSKSEEYLRRGFGWVGDKFLGTLESFILDGRTGQANSVEGRKHKKVKLNKYVFPLIVGFLLIKSVILPLALKALAILSGKAVVLSLMSLILAAIVGLRSVASGSPAQSKIDLVNVPLHKYRRKDFLADSEQLDEEPYKYYPERRRR